ncbi:probable salivary secreted peptide [Aethina tumida]|uniref:probable salivary secreted peptide n=1 Tax=Aethina tumida TaxID=116153 RepID=UPI0021495C79|nr:probable salivary secreted peptide [Aethina tumida]
MKAFLIFVALFAIALCKSVNVTEVKETKRDHNIDVCQNQYANILVLRTEITVRPGDGVVSRTVIWPDGGAVNKRRITCILVQDRVENGLGGYASLKRGGLGQYEVEILLESQPSLGFDFLITIYTE